MAGAANLSRLCGAAGMAAEKDLCAVAAYSGALSKSTRHLCGDRDDYLKEQPEYVDKAGFRRNTE